MKPFAKLFGSDDDQVLALLDEYPETQQPRLTFYWRSPSTGGVCYIAAGWDDDEQGWQRAEAQFTSLTEAYAREIVAHGERTASGLMLDEEGRDANRQ